MQRKKALFGQVVKVRWEDSSALNGWQYEHRKVREPQTLITIGYVVSNSKRGLTITTSLGEQGQSIDDLTIPWGCITRFEELPVERWSPDER